MKLKVKNPDGPMWFMRYLINGPLDGVDILKLHEAFGNTSRMELNQQKLYDLLISRGVECAMENNELYIHIDDKIATIEALKY